MAKGIENSWCALICMTEKYKESSNCRFEAEYVLQLKKPFIPLILQKSYKPDGWLGFMLGTKIYIDFTKYEFQDCVERVKKELLMIKNQNSEPVINEQKSEMANELIGKPESSIILASNNIKSIFNWSEADAEMWFNSKNMNASIKENFSPCDGRLLEQLYKMSIEVPEFFYTTLRTDTKASLKDIAYFSSELRLLFVKK